jgi:hydrogenase expression/formation protein HypC
MTRCEGIEERAGDALGSRTAVSSGLRTILPAAVHITGIVMCLGIPMQVIEIDGLTARCSTRGVEREVSLFMLRDENIVAGDFVMVHVGYAIQKMDEAYAKSTWELVDEMLALEGLNA